MAVTAYTDFHKKFKLYNQQRKECYCEEKEITTILPHKYYLYNLFSNSRVLEETYEKDVAEFTTDQIIDLLKMFNCISLNAVRNLHSQFNMYAQWCFQQNLIADGQNHYQELSTKQLLECVNTYIRDKQIISAYDIQQWVQELPNAREQFIVECLFEFGKSENYKEIINATIDDIDEEQGVMHLCTGRTVNVSQRLIAYAKKANEELDYYPMNGKKMMHYIDNGKIVKDNANVQIITNEFRNGRRLYSLMCRVLSYVGAISAINPNCICESGKLNYIKENAAAAGVDPIQWVKDKENYKALQNQYNHKGAVITFLQKYEGYL